jgi:phosphotransferase family enzyme
MAERPASGHPAITYWQALEPGRGDPLGIEVLQDTRKAGVYRLIGAGAEGTAVIAKQYRYENAVVERTMYEQVLPTVPVARLRYYGCVQPVADFPWLFIEDAGHEAYSPRIDEQRVVAAEWLGVMHAATADGAAGAELPDRGPRHYGACLRSAHVTIERVRADAPLVASDQALLERIATHCNRLAAHWRVVEQACAAMPRTVVHGDFVAKNLRVRRRAAGVVLLPLDWETAGLGLPTVDLVTADIARVAGHPKTVLASPEMEVYRKAVREYWPRLGGEDFLVLVNVGRIFRLIACLGWACEGLVEEDGDRVLPRSLAQFRFHQDELREATDALIAGL